MNQQIDTVLMPQPDQEAVRFFDKVPVVDWSNLERAHEIGTFVMRSLTENKPLFRRLIDAALYHPVLWPKCESHRLDYKIVIWDAPEKNFRIRIRMYRESQYERIHDHRFSFTTLVLRGGHRESFWAPRISVSDTSKLSDFAQLFVREEVTDRVFTIHHTAFHSTLVTPDSISLVFRGPAEKDRSFLIGKEKETGNVWWRYSQFDETKARRQHVEMTPDVFFMLKKKMEDAELI
jgi:hypothetical protein